MTTPVFAISSSSIWTNFEMGMGKPLCPLINELHNILKGIESFHGNKAHKRQSLISEEFGELAKEFIEKHYGEDKVNSEAIGYKAVFLATSIIIGYQIRYENLYSYVLACGMNIPYSQWTYSNVYYDKATNNNYRWNKKTGEGDILTYNMMQELEREAKRINEQASNNVEALKRFESKKVNVKYYGSRGTKGFAYRGKR